MNTVQHKRTTVTRHELHMEAPITARDIGDFVHQVNRIYLDVTGKKLSDDSYYVTGDEDGLTATFDAKDKP